MGEAGALRHGARLGARRDHVRADARVYGVPDPALPFEHLEHLLWRAYRTVWPNKRLDPNAVLSGPNADSQPDEGRPESLERDEIPKTIRTPRELLRTYWAWVELTH